MQQILHELQNGTHEVVKDLQDGTLEMRVKPPSALQLRAARLIVQIINERDQVVNSNVQLNAQLQQFLQENENLKQQIKDLNDRLNSSPVPQADSSTPSGSNSGIHPDGETEAPRSEAS
jgi:predicted phage-related endonuclease